MSLSALAVLAVRNEAVHLPRLIKQLVSDGLEIAVVDNGSTDGSREICEGWLGEGVTELSDLPWTGAFSLSEQLRAKAQIIDRSSHDWVVHVDADEWLQTPTPGQRLVDGLAEANDAGANCVNFNEFVFVPMPGEDFFKPEYAEEMVRYYFFEPKYPRLMRAWRRGDGLSNLARAGHKLEGDDVRPYETDFILRHYIVLSEAHAAQKYLGRRFSAEDLAQGWHRNRLSLSSSTPEVRAGPAFRTLSHPSSRDFDQSEPARKHFWEW